MKSTGLPFLLILFAFFFSCSSNKAHQLLEDQTGFHLQVFAILEGVDSLEDAVNASSELQRLVPIAEGLEQRWNSFMDDKLYQDGNEDSESLVWETASASNQVREQIVRLTANKQLWSSLQNSVVALDGALGKHGWGMSQ